MATLMRVDKNGTEYWHSDVCPKCSGEGYIRGYEFNAGGICFKCGGDGKGNVNWKVYTPEYEAKLAERRLAKAKKNAPENNQKWFKHEGLSEDGTAWVVAGNTYNIKDELKAEGAKYSPVLGWHFGSKPNRENVVEIKLDVFAEADYAGEYDFKEYAVESVQEKVAEYVTSKNRETSVSEYVGNVGDKFEQKVTLKHIGSFTSHFSYYGETNYVYSFTDENGNTIVWKTSTFLERVENDRYVPYSEGDTMTLKGKIKEHTEYKGEKQTVLTRCKVA